MTQERKHQKENLPQMSKLQIRNHPLPKMSRHLHNPHKLKPSLNNNGKMPPALSSSKKAKLARHSRPKMIPLLHCNRKTNPFLNNNSNTLLIHLHLARTVPVHFQIMAKNSNSLQQKIPVPYQRNRDTVHIQNLNRFNQCYLIFRYRSLEKYMSHILRNFCQNCSFPVIYSLKCLLLSHFSTNQMHLSYFSFQLAFSFSY